MSPINILKPQHAYYRTSLSTHDTSVIYQILFFRSVARALKPRFSVPTGLAYDATVGMTRCFERSEPHPKYDFPDGSSGNQVNIAA